MTPAAQSCTTDDEEEDVKGRNNKVDLSLVIPLLELERTEDFRNISPNNKPYGFRNRFRLGHRIGSGSFGEVYGGIHIEGGEEVAIKIESVNTRDPRILFEYKVYKALEGDPGIPKIYYGGTTCGYHVIVMELLGPSLNELFLGGGRRFPPVTVGYIGDQMIRRLESLHNKNFVHCDVKPHNFLVGLDDSYKVFMVDFGLSHRYREVKTGEHISYKEGRPLVGTARFASLNTHAGVVQSRRDDMESLMYVLLYFLRGSLPWQGLTPPVGVDKFTVIKQSKQEFSALAHKYPADFMLTMLKYCCRLRFYDKPDYAWLRRYLRKACPPTINNSSYLCWTCRTTVFYDSLPKTPFAQARHVSLAAVCAAKGKRFERKPPSESSEVSTKNSEEEDPYVVNHRPEPKKRLYGLLPYTSKDNVVFYSPNTFVVIPQASDQVSDQVSNGVDDEAVELGAESPGP